MRRLVTVTAFTAMLTFLRMASGFLISKVVAVYGGPSGIALLGQLQNLIAIFNGIIIAPSGNAVVRYTAENQDRGFEYCAPWWRASLQWMLILSAVLIPAGIIFSKTLATEVLNNSSYTSLVCVIFLLLPFSACSSLVNSVINGQQLYRRYISLGMISVLVSTTVMIVMIISYGTNGALMAASVQAGLIGFIMLVFSIKQPWFKLKYWWGKTTNEHRLKIGGYLLMAITSAVVVPLSLITVRKVIITNLGWAAAGQWQVVWKISEAYLSVITIALSTYYLPRLSSLSSYSSIKCEINNTAKIVFPAVVAMAIGIYFSRDILISQLFTSEFNSARKLFGVQLVGDVVKIISWLYAYPMISRGATKWFISTEIFFASSFVLFAIIFIPHFGLQGANIAYLINYLLYFIFVYFNLKRFSS